MTREIEQVQGGMDAEPFNLSEKPFKILKEVSANCPIHGIVSGSFHITAFWSNEDLSYTYPSPNLCAKCYVDWVSKNVTHVQSI